MKYVFLFILVAALRGYGQPCDPAVKPDDSQYSYRVRTGDVRCEGTVIRFRSGERINLVSFTAGDIRYNLNESGILVITTPETEYHTDLHVQGLNHSMNSNISYRLDMVMPEKLQKRIPIGEVLLHLKISPAHMGLFAYLNRDGKKIYLPVKAQMEGARTGYTETLSQSKYKISIITAENSNGFSWSLTKKGVSSLIGNEPYTSISGEVIRDHAIEIDITDKIKKIGGKEFILYVKTSSPDSDARDIQWFNLYIP